MGESFHDDETSEDSDSDPSLETEVEVTCPYCGEVVAISLDPDGGATQEYVEDCQVCCRPWQVFVSYAGGGSVEVRIEEAA